MPENFVPDMFPVASAINSGHPAEQDYLPNLTISEFHSWFSGRHRQFADALWFDRPGADAILTGLTAFSNEFESDDDGGRGGSYRRAQKVTDARITGLSTLLRMVSGTEDIGRMLPGSRLLDVLGGDGLAARVLRLLAPHSAPSQVLTSDIAANMVTEALRQGLPAVRQPAHYLFLRENSFDGVMVAYGTHHIAAPERSMMCREAYRVLRPGGRVVIHDFEKNSPVSKWFSEIVHRYCPAGHPYEHFSREELRALLEAANFSQITITEIYDPIRASGDTEPHAVGNLLDYLISMYGLTAMTPRDGDMHARLLDWISQHMRYDFACVDHRAGHWRPGLTTYATDRGVIAAEMPRVALVATAVKPHEAYPAG
jgi:ubiquinone/menaquinone biosynthesis C-methylase UbiE